MNKEEFVRIIAMIISFFPNSKINTDNNTQMELWYGMLKDLDFNITKLAITKMVTDEPYAPSNMIGAIRKYYGEITGTTPIANEDGYGMVQKAIRAYGYARPEEALASLPQNVRDAVIACGGWLQICTSEEPETMRAQFNRAMASINARSSSESRLNSAVKKKIKELQYMSDKVAMIELAPESKLDITERKQTQDNIQGMAKVNDVIKYLGLREDLK